MLTAADVVFDADRPISRQFGDVYFDADGPAEVLRVFLAPAAVAERSLSRARTFTVAELGFGTGLNFIVTAAAARSRLHFISFERYPLVRTDLARALKPWWCEYPLADQLLEAYPPLTPGWHRRFFDSGRIQLSVFFGDVDAGMADLAQQQERGVDAWFLDGFAPRKNPQMWHEGLFEGIAELSANAATLTTFSAAGDVRRRLATHGFTVRRIDQRPHKRHSTAAVLNRPGRVFQAPAAVNIVGAGLAGAATARALADKGIRANLVDRGEGIARGASAIPAAVLHPRLLPKSSVEANYRLQAFLHAAAWSRHRPGVTATGVLQLGGPNADPDRLRQIAEATPTEVAEYLEPAAASERAAIALSDSGLFFPGGLMVEGKGLAVGLANHPHIRITAEPMHDAPAVQATGPDLTGFSFLEVAALAGQLDRFACATPPRLPIVGDGACVPASASVWTGATYEYQPWEPARATAANAERYKRFFGRAPGDTLQRFRGNRAVTSDRHPIVGADGGVWFNLGHGSHGTTTAVFGAEIVASRLNGEVAPATVAILALLAPSRFRKRQARRPNPFRR